MQQMAMSWLVYRLTGSPMLLGLVAFLGQGPGFWVAPFAGMMADRYVRRKLMLLTQTLCMIQALALGWLTLSGHITAWQLLYLSAFLGIITGIDTPVRQAFVKDMLERTDDLGNAISLNSSVFNGARLIGPAIAGLTVASIGEGWCFLLNGLSYIAVLAALLSMRLSSQPPKPKVGYLHSLREGFSYAWRSSPIRAILLLVGLISLVGLPYSVLIPVYAHKILKGGPETAGYLMGAAGAGAFTGALYLASRTGTPGLTRIIPLAAGLFGLGLIGFSFSQVLPLSLALMFLVGLGMMLQLASSNILLQTLSDEDKRGRVMSIYSMSFLGISPLGSLILGQMATRVGLSWTLLAGGICCLLGAGIFAASLNHLQSPEYSSAEAQSIPPMDAKEPAHAH